MVLIRVIKTAHVINNSTLVQENVLMCESFSRVETSSAGVATLQPPLI